MFGVKSIGHAPSFGLKDPKETCNNGTPGDNGAGRMQEILTLICQILQNYVLNLKAVE